MISVVIPLYNKEACIGRTIQSVLNQTYSCFELIVVNDGSTDNSRAEVEKLKDQRIRIIDKRNEGVSSARNTGIMAATSEYIAFLDADDIWLADHLETISELIEDYYREATIFVTSIARITSLSEIKTVTNRDETSCVIEDYFAEASKPVSTISSSNFAVKRKSAMDAGMFNVTLTYGEDVEFWHKILRKEKLAKSTRLTAYYFVGAENRSDNHIVPLKKRYHTFDFRAASRTERHYLGKLACLILMDYARLGAYNVCAEVLNMYKCYLPYILRYIFLLTKKRLMSANLS